MEITITKYNIALENYCETGIRIIKYFQVLKYIGKFHFNLTFKGKLYQNRKNLSLTEQVQKAQMTVTTSSDLPTIEKGSKRFTMDLRLSVSQHVKKT